MMKLTTHAEDPRIPIGYAVREYDEKFLAPEIRDQGCRWIARHEDTGHPCDWYSWHRSYSAAVMATRGHGVLCPAAPRAKGRSKIR